MLLQRFYHEGLAQASYLLGCQKTGEAIVVDPNRDPQPYVAAADANGLRIAHVTETHIHADYLSGSRELVKQTGARLLLSAEGGPAWQYAFAAQDSAKLLHGGEIFRVGTLQIQAVHTPGHTPEHLCFVVTDLPASDKPVGAFTGDFIFAGDVGRPDLLERAANLTGTMRASAAQLFDSIQHFASQFPDYLQIWPGHGSGSACGKSLGAVPMSTLGYEKLANWALRSTNRERFIDEVLAGQPDPPRYFATMKSMNKLGPPLRATAPQAPRRQGGELDAIMRSGARVVDVRATAAYAAGYVPGTINLPLGASLAGRAGALLSYDADYYLVTGSSDDAPVVTARDELAMVGLDRCVGWFGADALEWYRQRGALEKVEQIDSARLATMIAEGGVTVVDVRDTVEWDAGHLPGAAHIPLGRLEARMEELGTGEPVVLHCQGGSRSAIAASILKAHGRANVYNLAGGYTEWVQAGHATLRDSEAASV